MGKWVTLTELGRELGFSAVSMGKELDKLGLRDPSTKKPTALSDKKKYANIVKYNKNGVDVDMVLWAKQIVHVIKSKQPNGNYFDLKAALNNLGSFYEKCNKFGDGSKREYMEANFLEEELQIVISKHLKKHSLEELQKIVADWPKEATIFKEFLENN